MQDACESSPKSSLVFIKNVGVPCHGVLIGRQVDSSGHPFDESSFDGNLHWIPVEQLKQIGNGQVAPVEIIEEDIIVMAVPVEPDTGRCEGEWRGLAFIVYFPSLACSGGTPVNMDDSLPGSGGAS